MIQGRSEVSRRMASLRARFLMTRQVWHLQRMLLKRVDATTNEQFLEVVLTSSKCPVSPLVPSHHITRAF